MFNHNAQVFNDGDPRLPNDCRGFRAHNALLHPKQPRQGRECYRLPRMFGAVLGRPEYVDDVNREGDIGQRRIRLQPPDILADRVNRDYLITGLNKVFPHTVNRLTFFIFCANDSNRAGLSQKNAHFVIRKKSL